MTALMKKWLPVFVLLAGAGALSALLLGYTIIAAQMAALIYTFIVVGLAVSEMHLSRVTISAVCVAFSVLLAGGMLKIVPIYALVHVCIATFSFIMRFKNGVANAKTHR